MDPDRYLLARNTRLPAACNCALNGLHFTCKRAVTCLPGASGCHITTLSKWNACECPDLVSGSQREASDSVWLPRHRPVRSSFEARWLHGM